MLEDFVQTGAVTYDNCEFRDNVNQKLFQLVSIKSDKCVHLQVDQFP